MFQVRGNSPSSEFAIDRSTKLGGMVINRRHHTLLPFWSGTQSFIQMLHHPQFGSPVFYPDQVLRQDFFLSSPVRPNFQAR